MTGSFSSTVQSRRWPVVGFLLRVGRRTLVESLYLLTAPVIAVVGLPLVLGGLCVGAVSSLVPGRSPVKAAALTPVRWFADVERWRIVTVRSTPVPPAAPRLWPGVV